MVEEYKNIYGTTCPNCNSLIKSSKYIFLNEEKELKKEILKKEMIKKLKDKFKGEY